MTDLHGCATFRSRILLDLDGDLPEPEREPLREHLAVCVACAAYRDDEALLPGLAAATPARDPSCADAVMDRVRREPRPAARPIRRGRLAIAAAACVLVGLAIARIATGPGRVGTLHHPDGTVEIVRTGRVVLAGSDGGSLDLDGGVRIDLASGCEVVLRGTPGPLRQAVDVRRGSLLARIAPDPAHPVEFRTDCGTARVLGTVLQVSRFEFVPSSGGAAVPVLEVCVREGRVRVVGLSGESVEIARGETGLCVAGRDPMRCMDLLPSGPPLSPREVREMLQAAIAARGREDAEAVCAMIVARQGRVRAGVRETREDADAGVRALARSLSESLEGAAFAGEDR